MNNEIKFYEVSFNHDYSIAIKGVRKPSNDEAQKFLQSQINEEFKNIRDPSSFKVTDVREIPESEVRAFFDTKSIDKWPVFGLVGGTRTAASNPFDKGWTEENKRNLLFSYADSPCSALYNSLFDNLQALINNLKVNRDSTLYTVVSEALSRHYAVEVNSEPVKSAEEALRFADSGGEREENTIRIDPFRDFPHLEYVYFSIWKKGKAFAKDGTPMENRHFKPSLVDIDLRPVKEGWVVENWDYEKGTRRLQPYHGTQVFETPVRYFECFVGQEKDYGEGEQPTFVIRGTRLPTVLAANLCCPSVTIDLGDRITKVEEISKEEAFKFFNMEKDTPVFGMDKGLPPEGTKKPFACEVSVEIGSIWTVYANSKEEAQKALEDYAIDFLRRNGWEKFVNEFLDRNSDLYSEEWKTSAKDGDPSARNFLVARACGGMAAINR